MRTALAISVLFVLAACVSSTDAPSSPDDAAGGAAPGLEPAAEIDPFTLAIEAGRWRVIIERAHEGARLAPNPDGLAGDEPDALRIDRSLKEGAAELLKLRDQVCSKDLVDPVICIFKNWPSWTTEPATSDTPLVELQARSEWLGEEVSNFSGAGCEAGRRATGDDLFCSVE
ncbi:MAG: hypothetical protein R3C52_07725 [Hyphomonadaceae bacterium]